MSCAICVGSRPMARGAIVCSIAAKVGCQPESAKA